jgi:hypothetical protein
MFKDLTIKLRPGLATGFTPWLPWTDVMKIVAAKEQPSSGIKQIHCATARAGKAPQPNAVPVEQAVAMVELQGGTHIASPPARGKHSIQTQASILPIARLKPNTNNGDAPQEFQGGCEMYPYTIFCFKQRTAPCS